MPRLTADHYNSQQVALQPLAAPRVNTGLLPNIGTAFGGAFQQVGQDVQQVVNELDRARIVADKAEATRSITEGSVEFDGILQINKDQIADPEAFHTKNKTDIDDAIQKRIDRASNEQVKAMIRNGLSDNQIKAGYQSQHLRFEKTKLKALGDADVAIEQMAQAAARTTPENREGVARMFGDLIGNMQQNNFFTAKQASDASQAFVKRVDTQRAGQMLFQNPQMLKAIVETDEAKKQFPNLKPEELYSYGQKASELIKERQQQGEMALKERTERVNQDMLKAITAPGASLVALREVVRGRVGKDLSAKDGEHWIDNIDKMIKANQKEPKEVDPFKTSDSATLARVMSGVINTPEQWDSEKITAMMGNGLSVPHALRAVSLLERAQRDPAGTLTPMKQAQQTWNRLQSDFAFVPTEERQRGNPEAITKNNREAQRVFDQVQARADKGQDPRVVLEELMQPFYDEKIKGFFDRERYFPSYTREEGIKARQELIRRGLQPTDEAVKSTVDVLRRTNNPYAAPSPGKRPALTGEAAALDRTRVLEERVQQLQKEIIQRGGTVPEY